VLEFLDHPNLRRIGRGCGGRCGSGLWRCCGSCIGHERSSELKSNAALSEKKIAKARKDENTKEEVIYEPSLDISLAIVFFSVSCFRSFAFS
jgi:hypothetical protein